MAERSSVKTDGPGIFTPEQRLEPTQLQRETDGQNSRETDGHEINSAKIIIFAAGNSKDILVVDDKARNVQAVNVRFHTKLKRLSLCTPDFFMQWE